MTFTDLTTTLQSLSSFNQEQWLVTFAISACVVSLWVVLRSHKKMQNLSRKLVKLEHDLRVSNSSAIGMGQKLIALEKNWNQQRVTSKPVAQAQTVVKPVVTHKIDPAPPSQPATRSVYDEARRGLAQGNSVADVAKQCGLSYAEVSLLQALGRQTQLAN